MTLIPLSTRPSSLSGQPRTELETALRAAVEGEVRFDDGSRALYATDASNYRQVPIGVVIPHTIDDVVATVDVCRRFGAPVLARGGGTSLAGQCCNVAVVLDFSKHLNRILDLDPEARRARIEPGVVLDGLRDAAEAHHLTFGPDPATHSHCTLGGMIGNNSCGARDEIRAGTPVVGLEPSCAAVFRDEMVNLFPRDEDARRLSRQVFLLSEFLVRNEVLDRLPALHRRALLHGHCHQKALVTKDGEKEVLEAMGIDLEVLDSGCCGMAGSFGFEPGEHYEISLRCGERVLLPAVRQAPQDALIVADGFSCREQIAQGTGRHALHLAQVLHLALHEGHRG